MPNPNITQKSPTSVETFSYDWGQDFVTKSFWIYIINETQSFHSPYEVPCIL